MRILIAGSTGFVGKPLAAFLRERRHEVIGLTHRTSVGPGLLHWDPATRRLDPALVSGCDAVINLAGANIAGGRWTAARRRVLRESRLDATATLVDAITRAPLRPRVLLNASAVGVYGDRGDMILTEASDAGTGFLADLTQAWEAEARRITTAGVRLVLLRFGTVLGQDGGALGKLLPLFRAGLGGRQGNGRQWLSWISRTDAVALIARALDDERWAGPINVVAPEGVRNADFARALASAVRRPAIIPAPAAALRAVFGQMADETILASTRVVPARAAELGYGFRHPTLHAAFAAELGSKPSAATG